jgi:hypothetical protein
MNRSSFLVLATALFICSAAASAQAQVTRTFVSGTGTANSSCSYTAPCRFFTQAVAALPSQGGEIDVLDPGSYGQITITNSVSIIGRGWTTITATNSTAAITIAGSGKVNVNGVQLDGGGTAGAGINFTGSGTLNIQNSVIRNFGGDGILIQPTGTTQFMISDTLLSDNGGEGLDVSVASTTVTGAVDHVRAEGNTFNGFKMFTPSGASSASMLNVTISNSVAANNPTQCGISAGASVGQATIAVSDSVMENNSAAGLCSNQINGSTTNITLRNSAITNSGTAISNNGGTIWVTRSTISGNSTGIGGIDGGVLGSTYSFGDNNLFNNSTEGSFTSPQQSYK